MQSFDSFVRIGMCDGGLSVELLEEDCLPPLWLCVVCGRVACDCTRYGSNQNLLEARRFSISLLTF